MFIQFKYIVTPNYKKYQIKIKIVMTNIVAGIHLTQTHLYMEPQRRS